MTPKEKAEELFNRYLNSFVSTDKFGDFTYSQIEQFIKRCALIAVDEILHTIEFSSQADELSKTIYWQEVKQEVEKL